ncbi:MmcQ/YjbR family DNA-binding protein [Flavobacterium ardleyense]|uniref:MmcQ/YjbR family DNA-binding protein n=1 Tax=Flavobacterium ardleyense TaxID=2038737 RepID=A0ABW5Z9E8_9FLAO
MNIQQLYEFCLSKIGVTEHFPFDQDTLVFKVGGKIFALTSLSNWEKGNPAINLKCNPDKAIALRAEFEAIEPGYHMNKTHWNTVHFNSDVSDKIICELITNSYDLVFMNLPIKIRASTDF